VAGVADRATAADVPAALTAALTGYLDHLMIERGLARNTLLSYRRDLVAYLRDLAGNGVSDVGEVTEAMITGYVASLRAPVDGSPPLAVASVARALAAVRGWHKYLVVEGTTGTDPAREVRPPKKPQRLPKALTVEQVSALLEAAGGRTDADGRPRALRDRALLEFLYATGARISEAVGLDVDDFDPSVGSVRLFGKGSKERVVPVGSFAVAAVDDYLVRGRPALAQARAAAFSTGGRRDGAALLLNARGGRLSRQSAWQVLRDAAERAGLTEHVSPHTLRHSFATHLLAGGADVRVVQELLGHASVTTTQIYTLVTVDSLREVFTLAHPRAR
jgi:integrase/recombinase XerD